MLAKARHQNSIARTKTFAFSKRHLLILSIWPAFCLSAGGLLWKTVSIKLEEDKAAVIQQALERTTSLSKVYSQQVAYSLQQIDLVSLHVKYDWENHRSEADFEKQSKAGLYPVSTNLYVTITDRHGERVASTFPGSLIGKSLADRAFFKHHKTSKSKELLISALGAGHRTGKSLARFTRRLETPTGEFDGVVVVSAEPTYLTSFADQSQVKDEVDYLLLTNDGVSLAETTGTTQRNKLSPSQLAMLKNPQGATWLTKHDLVRTEASLVAWEKVKDFPVIAVVSQSESAVLASHIMRAREYHRLAIAGTAFLFFIALSGTALGARLLWRRSREDEVKQHTEEVKKAYRLATDGAREGFFMVQPIYDDIGKVIDFRVEDCNECGAAFYGTTRAQHVGVTFTKFWPGEYAEKVIEFFASVMDGEVYEDEFKSPPDSPLKIIWAHRRIVPTGAGLAITIRDISEAKAHEEALSRLANADSVTSLRNRHWFVKFLPVAIEDAQQAQTRIALLFIDLDDFKNVNDTLGHEAGDALLQAVAARLEAVTRPQDYVVRLGGDEFTVVLQHVHGQDDVQVVAQRIMASFHEPFVLPCGTQHLVRSSIGISIFPEDGMDGATLLKHADIAMYAAKAGGKHQYRWFDSQMSKLIVERVTKEQALRQAIEADEFILYFQPRVGTHQGDIRGLEALVRWIRPGFGLVPPNEFIPLAEETGLIVPLGELVIKKTFEQLASWKAQSLLVVPVSVNVSPRQFNEGTLSALFVSYMAKYGIDSSLVEIEITESSVVERSAQVTVELAAIENLGMKLLVDDFGTGYSSLSQLQRLDVDVLKVDRAFTAQLGISNEGDALFMAVVSMAHVLGLSVTAEGVETMEQLSVLRALSCNEIQGYLISRPVPADEVPALLTRKFLLPTIADSEVATS